MKKAIITNNSSILRIGYLTATLVKKEDLAELATNKISNVRVTLQ